MTSRARLLRAVVAAAMLLPRLPGTRRYGGPVTAILAPSDPGNVGDRAMLAAACRHVTGPCVLLSVADGANEAEAGLCAVTVNVRGLFERAPVAAVAAAWRLGRVLRRAVRFLVIGADVMDGGYSAWRSELRFALAALASRGGQRSAVVNMSWNAAPHPRAVTALRRARDLPLVARDAVSARRLLDHGALNVTTSADIAFLSDELADPGEMPGAWLTRQCADGRPVAVVNLNPLVAPPACLVELVKPACERLLASGTSLLLLGHDSRDASDRDGGVHRRLLDELGRENPGALDRVIAWQATGPAEVRAVLRSVSFAVSCRMHLIILAATVGVPAIGFEYQGKMTGLFDEHFGAPEFVVDVATATPDDVVKLVERLESERDELAAKLHGMLPALREKALRNLPA